MPVFWNHFGNIADLFSKMMQMCMMAIIAEAGYNVLLQDADVFWLKDPRYDLLHLNK